MKKSTFALILGSAAMLSACGSLHNVDSSWCDPEEKAVQPEPVIIIKEKPVYPERINLAADALFKFDKHAPNDLLAKGKETLDELAHKLSTGYAAVDRIDLVGHTDRLGSEQYNYNLGLNRAKTVKAYLESKGVNAPMFVASKGESEPVTTACTGNKANAALIECLQPDRRVVVDILGTRKGSHTAE